MKILVTGATGYIGHKIALAAAAKGEQVAVLARDPDSPNVPVHPNIRVHRGDILDPDSISKAMQGCDRVVHAAGLTRLYAPDKDLFYRVNVQGTRNVMKSAMDNNITRLVYTSSCAVLGPSCKHPVSEKDPRITAFENDYEISKYWAELEVLQYVTNGLNAVIVSPSRVYGPGPDTQGNPLTAFFKKTLRRKFAVMPAKKEVTGNYVFVDDVVDGHLLALEKGRSGEKYILGGENLSYNNFFCELQQHAKIRLLPLPRWALQTVAIAEMTGAFMFNRQTQLSPKVVRRFFENRAVTSQKAIDELAYSITPFSIGLAQTLKCIIQNPAHA